MQKVEGKAEFLSKDKAKPLSQKRIEMIIDSYKDRLQFNRQSIATVGYTGRERLSLKQFKCLETLQAKTRCSLNSLYRGYYREQSNIEENRETIDPEKLRLFQSGTQYRSRDRAKGVGVKKVNWDETNEYYKRQAEEEGRWCRTLLEQAKPRRFLSATR